ncbi:MAG: hypothetical protein IJV22_06390 [Bacteroidales bacterium]|nr:hypothetical protein [Bacteroidales bacterium]
MKPVGISLLVAVGLLGLDYAASNSKYRLFENERMGMFCRLERWTNSWREHDECKGALFVDVSNAKHVVSLGGTATSPQREVITDPQIILEFLQKVDTLPYAFLFLDIQFQRDSLTPWDTLLADKLLHMHDIAIAKNEEETPFIDASLRNIAFATSYTIKPYDNRCRYYEIEQEEGESVAWEMYRHTIRSHTGHIHKLWHWSSLYCEDKTPITNYLPLTFHINSDIYPYQYNIEDLLNNSNIWNRFKDICAARKSHIIVGDFKNDTHWSYIGMQSGPMNHWLAFQALCKRKHHWLGWYLIIPLLTYFLFALLIMRGHSRNTATRIKQPALRLLLSFVSFGTLTALMTAIIYVAFDRIYSFALPAMVFTLWSNWWQVRHEKKNK